MLDLFYITGKMADGTQYNEGPFFSKNDALKDAARVGLTPGTWKVQEPTAEFDEFGRAA